MGTERVRVRMCHPIHLDTSISPIDPQDWLCFVDRSTCMLLHVNRFEVFYYESVSLISFDESVI